jgi:hypothetical protein
MLPDRLEKYDPVSIRVKNRPNVGCAMRRFYASRISSANRPAGSFELPG